MNRASTAAGPLCAAALLTGTGWLSGCASSPPAGPVNHADARLDAALTLVRDDGSRERWYGLYQGNRKYGHLQVTRRVESTFVEITRRFRFIAVLSDGEEPAEFTSEVVERFDTAPPGRALLLRETTEVYGRVLASTIEWRGSYYYGISDDAPGKVLADFQYTLADRFAPHTWVSGHPAEESCIAYPTYDTHAFERTWLTECVMGYDELDVAGEPTAVATLLQIDSQDGQSVVQRALDGQPLLEMTGGNSYLRAETEAVARAGAPDAGSGTL